MPDEPLGTARTIEASSSPTTCGIDAVTPGEFIVKWRASELKERSASQEHFIDLCRLLAEPTPAEADPAGEWYCFERGARKDTGGDGCADVWKRGCFAWEYKGRRADLDAAFNQLRQYALALENPPLLIVSDMARFRIRTNWTNSVSVTHEFTLDDLADGATRDKLKWAMSEPERLRPGETRQTVTERAAATFAELAQGLRDRDHDPQTVAHFVNRLVFCMFAEDVGLLPGNMFTRMLERTRGAPDKFTDYASRLFGAMATGGDVGFEPVAWFNGGLFDDDAALPLDREGIETALKAAALDWSEIDPSILGTLFERGLDPDKRSQLGAHYTDRDKIMRIVEPVIVRPLLAEWETAKVGIAAMMERADAAGSPAAQTRIRRQADQALRTFLERLRRFTVLDPACGSGNFLYLALHALKDIEHRVQLEAETLGLARGFPAVGPANVKGIEINAYAAELARVSVWIGEIQWMRRNGFSNSTNPILDPLDTIECRDAILAPDDGEPDWPRADVVIGNPPFLGDRVMRGGLGHEYTERLRRTYKGSVPGSADLVCYWFAKAGALVAKGKIARAGLVATNSIRGGNVLRSPVRACRGACEAGAPREATGKAPQILVATRRNPSGHVAGARRSAPFHRNPDCRQASAVCLARCSRLPRPPVDRHRPRRRYDVRHPAQPIPRGVVAADGHKSGGPSALHPEQHLRDLPLPGRPLAGYSRRRLCRRPASRRHWRCRASVGRTPRPLAQPVRMGRVGGRAGAGLSEAPGCPRRGGGEGTQGSHADQPLQCPPAVARSGSQRFGRGGGGGVWVG